MLVGLWKLSCLFNIASWKLYFYMSLLNIKVRTQSIETITGKCKTLWRVMSEVSLCYSVWLLSSQQVRCLLILWKNRNNSAHTQHTYRNFSVYSMFGSKFKEMGTEIEDIIFSYQICRLSMLKFATINHIWKLSPIELLWMVIFSI